MNARLKTAAQIVISDCLNVRKKEKVVIITDKHCRAIGNVLWHTVRTITDPLLIEIAPRTIHGEEPPLLVAEVLKKSDVFIIPTDHSLTHTHARITANKCGARGATMPGITVPVMERTLNADYRAIASLTKKIASLINKARYARIVTGKGFTLHLDLTGRKGHLDTGIITHRGEFSNLPAGEAYIAPVESKSRGKVVIDGSFAPIGFLKKPVTLTIEKGEIVKITGNNQLTKIFRQFGKKERTLCEFGIGTNPKAIVTGNVLEDEKVMGSIHFAFGNNLGFGGKNNARIHLDGVIKRPSVWLDDTPFIRQGRYLI